MDERSNEDLDVFEKAFLLGVGFFSLTKDKVQDVVDELVERGRLSREEGRDLVSEIGERGAAERDNIRTFIADQVRKATEKMDIATKGDIERLESEIALLRAEVLSGAVDVGIQTEGEDLSEGNL